MASCSGALAPPPEPSVLASVVTRTYPGHATKPAAAGQGRQQDFKAANVSARARPLPKSPTMPVIEHGMLNWTTDRGFKGWESNLGSTLENTWDQCQTNSDWSNALEGRAQDNGFKIHKTSPDWKKELWTQGQESPTSARNHDPSQVLIQPDWNEELWNQDPWSDSEPHEGKRERANMPLMPLLGANLYRVVLEAAVLSHGRHRWERTPTTTDNAMVSEGINEIPGGLPVGLTGEWIMIYVPRWAPSGFPAQNPTGTDSPETRGYWYNKYEKKT